MHKLLKALPLLSATFLSTSVFAEESPQIKSWNIGVGTYASVVNIDSAFGDEDIEFTGVNFAGTYAFSDTIALRAGYFSLENEDDSALKSTGIDVNIYFGTGLASEGFKVYIGGGLFSDTWEFQSEEEDFSGIQFNGGIGYNWEIISLELIVGIRSASEYADFIEDNGGSGEIIAVSSSLLLSGRF